MFIDKLFIFIKNMEAFKFYFCPSGININRKTTIKSIVR